MTRDEEWIHCDHAYRHKHSSALVVLVAQVAYQNEMLLTSIPDTQGTNLAYTILIVKEMGIKDLFDFMDPLVVQNMITALELLYMLSTLDDEGFF